MALKQAVTQSSGYDATYWRIDQIRIDWRNENARIRLTGYKNEAERNDNPRSSVMDSRNYNISGHEFDKFFKLKDKSEYPEYDPATDYSQGDEVVFKNVIYEAVEDITSGGSDPDQTVAWELKADLRVNRKIAYDYIKNNDIDFTDAESV